MTSNWLECREVCADCPLRTERTAKTKCAHIWRHLVEMELQQSGDGTVPFDTPERSVTLGATVSRHRDETGKRPSVQVFEEEPPTRHGYQKAKIKQTAE